MLYHAVLNIYFLSFLLSLHVMQHPEFIFSTPLFIQTVVILFKIRRRKKFSFMCFEITKSGLTFFEGKYHKQQITASHIYMSHLSKWDFKKIKKKIAAGVSSGLRPK